MKTQPVLSGKRLDMATRARRRRLVTAVYLWSALLLVVWFYYFAISAYSYAKLLASLFLFLAMVVLIAFWAIAGDMRARGDEREMHRRDHAHLIAYRFFSPIIVAVFLVTVHPVHPIFSPESPLLRAVLYQLPSALMMVALFLYITLPQAILIWTEPDMEDSQ